MPTAYKSFLSFSKHLGLPMKGFVKQVDPHLRKLEAWMGSRVVGSGHKKRLSPASRFEVEFWKLDCSINHNLSRGEGEQEEKVWVGF